jgi:probable F420-dependent oxidoreductase
MRFGVSLSGLSPRHYPSLAREAELSGFESVWVPDHLVLPETMPVSYPYTGNQQSPIPSTTAVYDPWVLLGAMAAVTETIRFSTAVYVLPLRHPIATARSVLTVDRISRGRVTLGAGVGWLTDEFAAVGLDAGNRGGRTDEIIPLLRRFWTEPVIEHHGVHYDIPPVRFEPKPFQKPIPIEIGGSSPAALRRAGRLGDGWIEIGTRSLTDFGDRLEVVRTERARVGREHVPFLVTGSIDVDHTSEYVARLAEIGVDRVVLRLPDDPAVHAAPGDVVRRFADTVIHRPVLA